ncbi:MAG TPA: NUDIX hydrolase [Patescibacteria group bacterium]
MKNFQQVAVSGAIFNDSGEILMVKRSMQDDFLPGFWEMPGGGTDFGEHPVIALKRELKEEVGLDVEVKKPFFVNDYYMDTIDSARGENKIHRVEIFFHCFLKNINQAVTLSHEHSEYKWIGKDEKLEMTDYTKEALQNAFKSI